MDKRVNFIDWDEHFVLGVPVLDRQHENLVNKINYLHQIHSRNAETEIHEFLNSVYDVVSYTRYHFNTEEKLMLLSGFHGYTHHRNKHQKYISEVRSKSSRLREGKPQSLDNYIQFLRNWVLLDIAVCDRDFTDFIFSTKDHRNSRLGCYLL